METRIVTIASAVGLHARPAALFVAEVKRHGIPITIGCPGSKAVNAASLLGVMSLGLKHGEQAELSSEAEGTTGALDELVAFLEVDHDAK